MDPLASLDAAIGALRDVWAGRDGQLPSTDALDRARLLAVNDALGVVRRQLDAIHVGIAAGIARESRPELGPESLAKEQGYRNPIALIAATTGASTGDASRLVKVGEATAKRMTLSGEAAPARHPHVAASLETGAIGTPAAAAIVAMLDRVAARASASACDEAEGMLCARAAGLSLDQLLKLITRAEAWIDPDGIEPREQELRADRVLHMVEKNGMLHLTARLDPESAAPVKAAIESLVTAEFRAAADRPAEADVDGDRRTVPQLQADALTLIARHALGCSHSDLPLDGATVIVRVSLEDLENGTGSATIDGITQPVSIAAARRMAAGGGCIPAVLSGVGEILDWGRERRLFTKAQRLALVERDGGCAMCGLPPSMTRAHHLKWWKRDAGPTDLSNGVLLCESCHHRIHDNGWEILIDGVGVSAKVWFIPPPHVDPVRTPRLGGRARFDFLAA